MTLLEAQTYIQRNGNVYEYLTNEEQVIEEEIKNVDIDSSEVSTQLFKILSGDVIKTTKIRYAKNGQDFPFGFKLDDQVHGPQRELAVHFITPEYPHGPEQIRMHSAGKDELRVILEPDERVLSDLRLLLKTDKYTKRKQTTSLSAIEEQILRSKATLNREREKELVQRLHAAVGHSALLINAADVSSSSQDALVRVTDGFQELVSRTYTQLKLLGGATYTEQQVAGAANPHGGLFDAEALLKLDQPAQEVLATILRKDAQGEQVTMKTLVDTFQAKPYGWDLASIEVIVASLIGGSKITLTVDGNVLKRSEVATALRNTQKHGHEIIAPQKTFDERKVAAFRKFVTDFFDEGSAPKDPLELARHGADKLKGKLDELKAIVQRFAVPVRRPAQGSHQPPRTGGGQVRRLVSGDFNLGDDLLEAKDNVIDPIQSFLNGAQRSIYDDAAALLSTHSGNLGYLPPGSDETVKRAGTGRPQRLPRQQDGPAEDGRGRRCAARSRASWRTNRAEVTAAIEGRKADLLGSADYANATPRRSSA